ncbi:MAG: tRNA-His guanylyltransferase [Bathelium mastoideum]|nr:MAG: tRNA-His guanylyltransferase [Bathelium mastoideum]
MRNLAKDFVFKPQPGTEDPEKRLSAKYDFEKPNDKRALDLMDAAAEGVMRELSDLVLAYGVSDEFRWAQDKLLDLQDPFIFHKDCTLFERRESKLVTTIVSTFTSYYVHLWPTFFTDKPLSSPLPSFDGRAVLYPNDQLLRDYMSWRQVDCHINNLYNTTFWNLIQKGGMDGTDAEKALMVRPTLLPSLQDAFSPTITPDSHRELYHLAVRKWLRHLNQGTVSSDKNEILFSRFGINYNNEPEMFKKGSVLYRDYTSSSSPSALDGASSHSETNPDTSTSGLTGTEPTEEAHSASAVTQSVPISKTQTAKEQKARKKARIAIEHVDMIRDEFWVRRPWILSGKPGRTAR